MNCPNCQTPNHDGGKFCISCGYTLPQPPPSIPTEPVSQPTPQPAAEPTAPAYSLPASAATSGPFAPARPASVLPPKYAYLDATCVVVTDINMTFSSMVVFMVKWALAAVPALIILGLALLLTLAVFSSVIGGLLGGLF